MVKIEELNDAERVERPQPVKNPFEERPKKTIRRNANEIKKGLNEPQFKGTSKLDLLFAKLEPLVDGPLESLDIETLSKRLDIGSEGFQRRYDVIEQLITYLQAVQNDSEEIQHQDKLLIKISLHDIRTFSKLVNVVVVQGVYAALAVFRIGIPIQKRQLRLFHTSKKPLQIDPVKPVIDDSGSESYENNAKLLVLLYDGFANLFSRDLDVKDLLLKGTGYSDFLTVSAALSTIPYFANETRQFYAQKHAQVAAIPETYELMQTYSLLAASPTPPYFKQFVMAQLLLLHYDSPRGNGLLALIELICGLREKEDISTEAFDHVARIVLAKPRLIPTPQYFKSIGDQAYNLLVNINRPIVANCICHFLVLLWHKNQLVLRDFFISRFWSVFDPKCPLASESNVLVSEAQLNNNVNVLLSLTKNGLPADFLTAIFLPILVPIWSYFKFLRHNRQLEAVIKAILRSFLLISEPGNNHLNVIAGNLTVEGTDSWNFAMGPNNLPQIEKKVSALSESARSSDSRINAFLGELDESCASFVDLCRDFDDVLIQDVFLVVLKKWLKTDSSANIGSEDPFFVLVDLRLLEAIGNAFKERLARTPHGMLEVVYNVLLAATTHESSQSRIPPQDTMDDSDDEEDESDLLSTHTISVALELASAILSETSLTLDQKSVNILKQLVQVLHKVHVKVPNASLKATVAAFTDRINSVLDGDTPVSTIEEAQKQTFKKAITSLNDPLVPVRAHGLFLLRTLVEEKSSVLSLEFVMDLHLNQLKDSDPFVYLNAIKGLRSLIEWDEPRVLVLLISVYAFPDEDSSHDLDERLKIGEVLLRYIQEKGAAFSGDAAQRVSGAALHLIRREEGKDIDSRLRMSAMSLLGVCCKTNPLGTLDILEDALDCAIGILQLEKDPESSVMRRAAVVLIGDMVEGTSMTDKVPFPTNYTKKVWETLTYISTHDTDVLTREQARLVLDYINELFKLSMDTD